jgi:glycosyltransferase involved in cell wall biosynthesis
MTKRDKRVAVLSPIAWRTPPRQYGAWETVASNITEGLVARGWDVTLFASRDSVTRAHLHAVVDKGYEEDSAVDPKVAEYLHISEAFERAAEFDLIHSHYDFMALTYTRLVKTPVLTTIHGFSSAKIMPVYQKYRDGYFVSISDSDRATGLNYLATVYNGIDLSLYPLQEPGGDDLIFLGRIHPDKGVHLAIEVARLSGMRLIIAGIIQDEAYFREQVKPHLDDQNILYIGPVGVPGKNELFARARALVHLNTIPERFGLVLVEANAAGVPVIAMDLGSCREVIKDGQTGFLVDNVTEAVRALDEFLKSIVVPAAAVSGNTFRSMPWWRDTNGFTRRFLIWKRRDDHEVRHCQTVPPQPHPHQGRNPLSSGNRSQRGGREA